MIDFDKINLNRLYYFYYVATCKNITKAAIEANVYQSSMTRQMIALEKEIGTKLLNRHSDGVTLTRAGEEVFGYAERIAREVGAIRKQLDEKDKIAGKIRICTTYAIANYILAEHLMEFTDLYPDIHLDVICNDYSVDLVKNDVDVVIRPYDFESTDIIQEPMFSLQGQLYASQKYIKNNGYPETKEDLKNHKFIACSRPELLPFNASVDWFLKIENCTSMENCFMKSNSLELVYRAAQEGKGIISGYKNMTILKNSDLISVAPRVKGKKSQHYFTYSKQAEKINRIQVLKSHLFERLSLI